MHFPPLFSAVPDWFSWENQGVDVAVADLTGSGRPDVLVLAVDDGPQQNRGVYRMGRDLDAGRCGDRRVDAVDRRAGLVLLREPGRGRGDRGCDRFGTPRPGRVHD